MYIRIHLSLCSLWWNSRRTDRGENQKNVIWQNLPKFQPEYDHPNCKKDAEFLPLNILHDRDLRKNNEIQFMPAT